MVENPDGIDTRIRGILQGLQAVSARIVLLAVLNYYAFQLLFGNNRTLDPKKESVVYHRVGRRVYWPGSYCAGTEHPVEDDRFWHHPADLRARIRVAGRVAALPSWRTSFPT